MTIHFLLLNDSQVADLPLRFKTLAMPVFDEDTAPCCGGFKCLDWEDETEPGDEIWVCQKCGARIATARIGREVMEITRAK